MRPDWIKEVTEVSLEEAKALLSCGVRIGWDDECPASTPYVWEIRPKWALDKLGKESGVFFYLWDKD